MSADTMFWAGMAGGRKETINDLRQTVHGWQDYADELEQTIARLNYIAKDWQEEAVAGRADARVAMNTFREATGKTVRDYLGNDETERRLEAERKAYRNEKGLKR